MGKEFNYRCDACGKVREAVWNHDQYIEPEGWLVLMDSTWVKGCICEACGNQVLAGCFAPKERKVRD